MKKRYVLSILAAVIVAGLAFFIMERRRPGPSGPTPDEIVKELLEFDRNGDGQLNLVELRVKRMVCAIAYAQVLIEQGYERLKVCVA